MQEYQYRILESENYDGDSFNLTLDLGFGMQCFKRCRLEGVDTPELRDRDLAMKAAGYLAKQWVEDFIADGIRARADGMGDIFFVSETYSGKFGRALGNIVRVIDGVETDLRSGLLNERLGVVYNGENKSIVRQAHRDNVLYLTERGMIQDMLSDASYKS